MLCSITIASIIYIQSSLCLIAVRITNCMSIKPKSLDRPQFVSPSMVSNIYSWVEKKMYCDDQGIKYLHGVECYLTKSLTDNDGAKVRDNYHTILIAKNYDGVMEINRLCSLASQPDHFYYKPRLTFDEFLAISDNVIKISACLASPLNKMRKGGIRLL